MTELQITARHTLEQWGLRQDGPTVHGATSVVLPVRTSDGTPAVLTIRGAAAESEHEHLVLRRWGGDGAVRLLRADPRRHAVLLGTAAPAEPRVATGYRSV